MTPQYAVRADVLPDGTRVRRGCLMLWSNYVLGRDPTLWDTPTEFTPERWLEGSSNTEGQ
eukprot:SAG11_NODE_17864_length_507_cov_0.627451_1_plen_59_part_10